VEDKATKLAQIWYDSYWKPVESLDLNYYVSLETNVGSEEKSNINKSNSNHNAI
jgi:hypothetical protein